MNAARARRLGLAVGLLALAVRPARLGAQVFEPSLPVAERTQVLVLGSPHLSSRSEKITASHLEPLLVRLESFAPQQIAVEHIPAAALADMQARAPEFDTVLQHYGSLRLEQGAQMQALLDLTWQEARAEAEALLEELGERSPRAEERRELIGLMLASYDDLSALLHWSFLPEEERRADPGLPERLREELERQLESRNESVCLGVALARRLGRQRLFSIDDHHDKDDYLLLAGPLMEEVRDEPILQEVGQAPLYQESEQRLQAALAAGNLLPYYRWINAPDYGLEDARLQWDCWFQTRLPSRLDRSRVALWEVRNLNMVSHIRRVTARRPGGRLLVIVGVGHKPFFESYLHNLSDIRLVQLADLAP